MSRTKTVTVYSPSSGEVTVSTTATNWDGLQQDLSRAGVPYSGLKAVIGETQLSLESGSSPVPDEDFTLFLMNQKTKAGGEDSPKS